MATTYSPTGCEPQNDVGSDAFDGIAPQFRSASQPLNKEVLCDVFINHRGIDVKYTIASCIYHALDLMGVVAFMDKEMLKLGHIISTTIQDAMRSASVHIAIFSKNYANSPWCLSELSYMLQTGTTIVPVFYHVEPSDLRSAIRATGLYADAFARYEAKGRYSSRKLQEWKMALHRVSFHSGYTLNMTNQDQGRLLKDVVECVLKEMRKVPLEAAIKKMSLEVPRVPPREIAQAFETTILGSLQREQNDFETTILGSLQREQNGFETTILGSLQSQQIYELVGMAGSEKTLKAKQLYKYRKRSSMDWCTLVYGDLNTVVTANALHHQKRDTESGSLTVETCRRRNIPTSTPINFIKEIDVAFTSLTRKCLGVVQNMAIHGLGSTEGYRGPDYRERVPGYRQGFDESQNIINFLPNPTSHQARSVMYDVSKHYYDTVVGCMEGATKILASKIDEINKSPHHHWTSGQRSDAELKTWVMALEHRLQHLESVTNYTVK